MQKGLCRWRIAALPPIPIEGTLSDSNPRYLP